MKIAILGAGLAGLELGRRLRDAGKDFIIIEKESVPGGLCRTNISGEYRWDFAVHALYSRDKEAMEYFCSLPLDFQASDRNVKIFHYSKSGKRYIIDYPFENGVRQLPLEEKLECIIGYVSARIRKKEYHNLEEWIQNRLGFGIARHFMLPYNRKIWNCQLSQISDYLVTSKIDPATALSFIKNVFWEKNIGREYQAKFIYPREGIQALCDFSSRGFRDKIVLNAEVEKLFKRNGKWVIVSSGRELAEAEMVVSTIPLVELLKKIDIEGVDKHYRELQWNNTYFIMVGLSSGCRFNAIHDFHWVFFKGKEIFYRITLLHNFSGILKPTLVVEVTEKGAVSGKDTEEIKRLVIDELLVSGLIGSSSEIAQSDIKRLEYTYPIPTVGLENIKAKIFTELKKHNLFLLGRSGNWDYINMDGVVLKVKEFINENIKGH
jgi:protoporphyrinogen oxidase